MEDDDLDGGLLAIGLSDSDDSSSSASKKRKAAGGSGGGGGDSLSRSEKTAQSEAAFQAVKASYRQPKIENGEIWKTIKLPLVPPLHKLEAQRVLHAVEELYFFARYDEAVRFTGEVLDAPRDNQEAAVEVLGGETVRLLRLYEAKCLKKMAESGSQSEACL